MTYDLYMDEHNINLCFDNYAMKIGIIKIRDSSQFSSG